MPSLAAKDTPTRVPGIALAASTPPPLAVSFLQRRRGRMRRRPSSRGSSRWRNFCSSVHPDPSIGAKHDAPGYVMAGRSPRASPPLALRCPLHRRPITCLAPLSRRVPAAAHELRDDVMAGAGCLVRFLGSKRGGRQAGCDTQTSSIGPFPATHLSSHVRFPHRRTFLRPARRPRHRRRRRRRQRSIHGDGGRHAAAAAEVRDPFCMELVEPNLDRRPTGTLSNVRFLVRSANDARGEGPANSPRRPRAASLRALWAGVARRYGADLTPAVDRSRPWKPWNRDGAPQRHDDDGISEVRQSQAQRTHGLAGPDGFPGDCEAPAQWDAYAPLSGLRPPLFRQPDRRAFRPRHCACPAISSPPKLPLSPPLRKRLANHAMPGCLALLLPVVTVAQIISVKHGR
ncbi:hypothetical protein Purlil1_1199 [Purpureocillium lilacinum]|uniref:Uncharacterized protein n=1 Tax=Purpureocillium lilacinum TaxID=33203 RepID=A0ABR0CE66_PURLI|nr:hypothetical protein Purlil1_1199 [Purpureocillium lilacinum]